MATRTPLVSPPAAARPFSSSPSSSFIGDDEEPATKVNMIPVDIQSAAKAAAAPKTAPLAPRPALAQKPTEERTMVISAAATKLPAAKSNEEDDFTSIIDNLGD
jgi:hypothetical protein